MNFLQSFPRRHGSQQAHAVDLLTVRINREQAEALNLLDLDDAEVIDLRGGVLILSKNFDSRSRILGLGFDGEWNKNEIAGLEQRFHDAGRVPRIAVNPFAASSLFKALGERRWGIESWMQFLLHPLDEIPSVPSDVVTVRPVLRGEEVLWAQILAQGFGSDAVLNLGDPQFMRSYTVAPSTKCVLAEIDGSPVGGGAWMRAGEVAMLQTASVLPAWRGQGVHRALLAHRLREAVHAGCRAAVYAAIPGSRSQANAEKAGFMPLYTRPTFRPNAGYPEE